MKCKMSGGHRTNAGNTAKINRLRYSYIENIYCKKWIYTAVVKRYLLIFVLERQRSRICLMNKNISFTVKIKIPVHVYIQRDM